MEGIIALRLWALPRFKPCSHSELLFSLFRKSFRPLATSSLCTVVLFIGGLPSVPKAVATTGIPTAVVTCATCASLSDLENYALGYFEQSNSPIGTVMLVSSLSQPISAVVKYMQVGSGKGGGVGIHPITVDEAGTITLDGGIYARATKIPPVNLPDIAYNDEPDDIVGQIQDVLIANGTGGTDAWHGLTNYPQFGYYNVVDTQTGQTYKVYTGDTITVQLAGGYSEQFKFLGVHQGTLQWQAVPNTLMLNGKPVTQPSNTSGTPVTGAGSISDPFPGGTLDLNLNTSLCFGLATTCFEYDDGSLCGSGIYTVPC